MILKLRTLTEKSKIGFGKYAENTVGDLLNRGNITHLSWIYYNCSNITFTDAVLDKMRIFRNKISKPGKAPELHVGIICKQKNTISFIKNRSNYKKEEKTKKRIMQAGRENNWFSKSKNAWKNQGH